MSELLVIAGASGVAKSSTARRLSDAFNIHHRIGSGFVREMAKHFVSEADQPSLYRYSFYEDRTITPFENLYAQSEVIQPMMTLALQRAHREGTGLIVEGVNVIPGLTKLFTSSIKRVVLYVKDEDQHFEMINSESHANRVVSIEQFRLVRSIQDALLERAEVHEWKKFDVTTGDVENELGASLFR